MLHVNERYVDETRDEKGNVVDYQYKYPENFNFAYDVVDAIAEAEPGRRAMIWCNPCGEEHVFTYGDLKRYSDKTANMLRAKATGSGCSVSAADLEAAIDFCSYGLVGMMLEHLGRAKDADLWADQLFRLLTGEIFSAPQPGQPGACAL